MLEGLTPPPGRNYTCKVLTTLTGLSDTDRAILETALADIITWPHNTLSNALASRGITLADTTISRHRKGLCPCNRGQ